MEEELINALKSIGLTEGESKAYLALLSIGSSTVGPIIDKSGISASKVYYILERLVNKGLASVMTDQGQKIYTAANPNMIINYLDTEKNKLDQNKETVQKILPLLNLKMGKASRQLMVESSRGIKGFENFYNTMIDEAKPGDCYVTMAGQQVSFRLQHYWHPFNEKISRKQISSHTIYEYGGWHKKDPNVHQRHKRKFYYPSVLPEKYQDLPNIATIGEITVMNHIEEGDIISLKIQNKEFTRKIRKLLKILYDVAEAPEKYEKKEFEV
jgi:predicted transcriptional regulator